MWRSNHNKCFYCFIWWNIETNYLNLIFTKRYFSTGLSLSQENRQNDVWEILPTAGTSFNLIPLMARTSVAMICMLMYSTRSFDRNCITWRLPLVPGPLNVPTTGFGWGEEGLESFGRSPARTCTSWSLSPLESILFYEIRRLNRGPSCRFNIIRHFQPLFDNSSNIRQYYRTMS